MAEINSPISDSNQNLPSDSPFKKWSSLGVISLGLAIVIIDTTLLNVSLSTIIRELHTDLQSLQWVITAYALILAAFTVTGGRFGDLFGRRKMFMLGAVIFAIGSFIASVSHNLATLLLGEAIIEGFGAALMLPATSALVAANFTGKDRATAFGIWGGVAGASSAIGPLLGGYLTSHFSWRWGFRINVFVGALVLIGSLLVLRESKDQRKPTIDWIGVALSSLGLLGVVFGIVESSTLGWWHAKQALHLLHHNITLGNFSIVPFSILLGVIILALFFWWEDIIEAKGKTPLVSDKLLKNQQFLSGAITVSLMTLSLTGIVFALPVFLQTVKNLDAFHTGVALLPISLVVLVLAPLTGQLSKKVTPKYIIQAGMLFTALASLILRAETKVDVSLWHLVPGLVAFGLGIGLVIPPATNLILSAVSVDEAGEASGVNNTMRQIGTSLGAAIVGAALLTSLSSHLVKGVEASQIIPEQAKAQIIQTVSNPNSNIEFGSGNVTPAGTPQIIKQEISQLVADSTTQAARDAYVYAALIAFFGFISALYLPATDVHEHGPNEQQEQEHSARKMAVSGGLIILAIAGSFWLLHQSANAVPATGLVDINAIRSSFAPPVATGNPKISTYIAPQSLPVNTGKVAIRGPEDLRHISLPQPPARQQSIYSNTSFGFQMQLSNTWQAKQVDAQTVDFVSSTGQHISVQVFKNPGEDLNEVQAQLAGSSSIRQLSQSNFKGQPALAFYTSSGQQGLAVIYNNRLYYIMASNLNAEPVTSFIFI